MMTEHVLVVKHLIKGLPVITSIYNYPIGSHDKQDEVKALFIQALKFQGKELGVDFTIERKER